MTDHRVVDLNGNPVTGAAPNMTPADVVDWLRDAMNDFECGIAVSFGLQQQKMTLQSARIKGLELMAEVQDRRISALEIEVERLKVMRWWRWER